MLSWLQNHLQKVKVEKQILTFLYTFTDAVRFLEEVVMVALATAIQEVFAFSCILVVVPAWEGAFTGSDHWSCSTRVCRETVRGTISFLFTFDNLLRHILRLSYVECRAEMIS